MIEDKIFWLRIGIDEDGKVSARTDGGGRKKNSQVVKVSGDIKNGASARSDRGTVDIKADAAVASSATPSPSPSAPNIPTLYFVLFLRTDTNPSSLLIPPLCWLYRARREICDNFFPDREEESRGKMSRIIRLAAAAAAVAATTAMMRRGGVRAPAAVPTRITGFWSARS